MGGGIFNVENKMWQFLNRMTDLFMLSMLAVVFSIPVVTIGSAMCGFYFGAMRIFEDTDGGVWSDFWYAFRKSFRQATILWLCQLAAAGVLLLNLWLSMNMEGIAAVIVFALSAVVLLFVGMVSMFAYPMTARYRFSLRKILSDSVSIVIGWFPHACALAVLAALLVYAAYRFHYLILFVPAVLGYQIARVNTWIFQKFERYDAKNTEDKQDEHTEE